MARLSLSEASALAARAFGRAGVPALDAARAADILAIAEAMGIATHGLSRVRVYADRIAAGGIDPADRTEVVSPAPALRRVDGRNGLGPAVAERTRREAAEAARTCGIGAAFVTGGNHLGALAPYLYLAAEAGFAAIVSTTTAPMIAPAGGREARIGNNPLGLAIPGPDGNHVLLDMALSVVSRSRVRSAAREGRPIPESWATDADGRPTTDPARAMQGLMRAIGADKGANLALCLDLMISALSGAATLSEITTTGDLPGAAQNVGHVFILIDAARLLPETARRERLDAAGAILGGTAPVNSTHPVRMPGARALEALRVARRDGLNLKADLVDDLRELART